MEIDHNCANPACDCRVENAGDFCCEACRQHGDHKGPDHDQCTCGHTSCAAESTSETRGAPDQK